MIVVDEVFNIQQSKTKSTKHFMVFLIVILVNADNIKVKIKQLMINWMILTTGFTYDDDFYWPAAIYILIHFTGVPSFSSGKL